MEKTLKFLSEIPCNIRSSANSDIIFIGHANDNHHTLQNQMTIKDELRETKAGYHGKCTVVVHF